MHLSMHNWMRAEPLEVTIRRLARYGYESIEISGEPEQYDTKEARGVLQENGVNCWGAVTLMLGKRNLIARDEAQRASSVQYVKDCVTMVKELDGHVLTIIPSTVGKIEPEAAPDEEWQWAVESMQDVYDHAQKEGVRVAVEPLNRFETYFVSRAAQAVALAEATGPECGVVLDTFHMNIEEVDMLQSLRDARQRLAGVHVADSNRMACGMGHLNWSKVIGTLQEIKYDGALTVEFVAPIDRTPANEYLEAIEKEPVDISPEQQKFIQDHGSSLLSEQFYSSLVKACAATLKPLLARA